jgi:hypothetical protein
VTGDWRDWRPAIWLVMLGIAVMLLVAPWYLGAIFLGGAIGAAIRIRQLRHRAAIAAAAGKPGRTRRR